MVVGLDDPGPVDGPGVAEVGVLDDPDAAAHDGGQTHQPDLLQVGVLLDYQGVALEIRK